MSGFPQSMNVACAMCGRGFQVKDAGLGYNMGAGPEYCCPDCVPPAKTVDEALATVKTFIEG